MTKGTLSTQNHLLSNKTARRASFFFGKFIQVKKDTIQLEVEKK